MRAEVFSVDLQHGHVSSTVHLQKTQANTLLSHAFHFKQVVLSCNGTRPERIQLLKSKPHLQPPDNRKWCDWCWDAGQTLVEGELHGLHADDGPTGTVVQHHPAWVSGAARGLEDTKGTDEGRR